MDHIIKVYSISSMRDVCQSAGVVIYLSTLCYINLSSPETCLSTQVILAGRFMVLSQKTNLILFFLIYHKMLLLKWFAAVAKLASLCNPTNSGHVTTTYGLSASKGQFNHPHRLIYRSHIAHHFHSSYFICDLLIFAVQRFYL